MDYEWHAQKDAGARKYRQKMKDKLWRNGQPKSNKKVTFDPMKCGFAADICGECPDCIPHMNYGGIYGRMPLYSELNTLHAKPDCFNFHNMNEICSFLENIGSFTPANYKKLLQLVYKIKNKPTKSRFVTNVDLISVF